MSTGGGEAKSESEGNIKSDYNFSQFKQADD